MVFISDLQRLIKVWQDRANSSIQPSIYKDGVMDCIYELNQLIDKTLIDEMTEEDAREYLLSKDAECFSNIDLLAFYEPAI